MSKSLRADGQCLWRLIIAAVLPWNVLSDNRADQSCVYCLGLCVKYSHINTCFMVQHSRVGQGLLIVEDSRLHLLDTPHSVGLLWTNDQITATLTSYRHPCPPAEFRSTILASVRPQTPALEEGSLGAAHINMYIFKSPSKWNTIYDVICIRYYIGASVGFQIKLYHRMLMLLVTTSQSL